MTEQVKAEDIDFSKFMLQDTAVLVLKDPLGRPMQINGADVEFELYGPHTERYSTAVKILKPELEGEARLANQAEFLAMLTKEVRNFPFPGGAEAIYKGRGFAIITEQVRQFTVYTGNFWPAG